MLHAYRISQEKSMSQESSGLFEPWLIRITHYMLQCKNCPTCNQRS